MEQDVTIITPAYIDTEEKAQFLADMALSCDNQARVIVVDDGSPGDLEGFLQHYPVWGFERIEHAGKSVARNRAAELAETNTIYPLDADDALMPGAMSYLYSHWKGIPLYSDLLKWYTDDKMVHHFCTNFSCALVRTQFLSSVNILHGKDQWAQVGGWTPGMQLFEDWEYCARLMWAFCGQRLGRALIKYRQHGAQSTVVLKTQEGAAKRRTLQAIADFIERNTMVKPCCGGRKQRDAQAPNPVSLPATAPPPAPPQAFGFERLPGAAQGAQIVRATYLNESHRLAGPQIYRGLTTRYPYRVQYGVTIDVDIRDTCTEEDRNAGRSKSMLVRYPEPVAAAPAPVPAPQVVQPPPQTPRVPTIAPQPSQELPDLKAKLEAMFTKGQPMPGSPAAQPSPPPEGSNLVRYGPTDAPAEEVKQAAVPHIIQDRMNELDAMRVRDVLVASRGWDAETARQYHAAEKTRANPRKTVLNLLEKKIGET